MPAVRDKGDIEPRLSGEAGTELLKRAAEDRLRVWPLSWRVTRPAMVMTIRRSSTKSRLDAHEASGPQRLALMSGLRHYNNISIEGHFSGHGMPHLPCVMPGRAVARGCDTPTPPPFP